MISKVRLKLLRILMLSISVLLVMILVATNGIFAAEKQTITYWKSPHGDETALNQAAFEKFEKENPDYKVEFNIVYWDGLDQSLTAAYIGSNPPDIAYIPDEWAYRYAKEGVFMELGEWANELKGSYPENVLRMGEYKGELYGIPYLVATNALIFNRALFAQAGISGPPQTWDEYIETANKISSPEEGIYGTILLNFGAASRGGGSGYVYWTPRFWEAGVQLISADLKKALFNTEGGRQAVQFIVDLFTKHKVAPPLQQYTSDQLTDMVYKGKAGMWYYWPMVEAIYPNQAPDLDYGVAIPPKGPVKQSMWTNYGFLFMAQKSKNKDAAWKLIRVLTSPEITGPYTQALMLPSPNIGVTWDEEDPFMRVFNQGPAISDGIPKTAHLREFWELLDNQIKNAVYKQKTVEQALADAEKNINSILDGS